MANAAELKIRIYELYHALRAAERELWVSPLGEHVRTLDEAYRKAGLEWEMQRSLERAQQKVDRKAELRREFDAATKRSLRNLLADETVTGSFEGWRFATKTGVILELSQRPRPSISSCDTWEELRAKIGRNRVWDYVGGKLVDGFSASRAHDGIVQSVALDSGVAWQVEEAHDAI